MEIRGWTVGVEVNGPGKVRTKYLRMVNGPQFIRLDPALLVIIGRT